MNPRIIAMNFINFYYFVYSKMISFPFMYYELVADYNVDTCGTGKLDSRDGTKEDIESAEQQKAKMLGTNKTCKERFCCAMEKSDLDNVLSILELTCAFDLEECRKERLTLDYYSRARAASDFNVDLDMTKESEVLLAQLYIIFRILLQKEMGAPNSTHIGRLNNWIDWYKEEKNNPWQNHKAPSREENMVILKCLAGELSASSGRMDDDFCKFIAHLNEAKYFHAKLHKNYHNFIKAFSNKLHYIKKWENKAEFSTDD